MISFLFVTFYLYKQCILAFGLFFILYVLKFEIKRQKVSTLNEIPESTLGYGYGCFLILWVDLITWCFDISNIFFSDLKVCFFSSRKLKMCLYVFYVWNVDWLLFEGGKGMAMQWWFGCGVA